MKLAVALESRDKSETMIKTKFIRRRLIQGSIKHWCEKYAMFLLPFITVLREGLEAVVFIGGVSLSIPATAFPLAVVTGLGCGILIGYLIYRLVAVCHDRLQVTDTSS
jgi:high-affinity iron transporter